jgi:flagellar protein FlbD
MIRLHHFRGEEFFLNCDLVESIQSTPDTVLTLFDGRKMVVAETAEQVVELIRLSGLRSCGRPMRFARAEPAWLPSPVASKTDSRGGRPC